MTEAHNAPRGVPRHLKRMNRRWPRFPESNPKFWQAFDDNTVPSIFSSTSPAALACTAAISSHLHALSAPNASPTTDAHKFFWANSVEIYSWKPHNKEQMLAMQQSPDALSMIGHLA